ncbi:MAG: RHS repeat protein, partial [Phycisphaerales bacterium]
MCRLENPGDSINPDPAPDHCSGGGIGWGGGGGCDSSSQGGVDCPPAFSENSVDLYRGHKIESAVDLRIPVTGADFVVSRQYSSNPEYSSDGLVGERWTTSVVDVIQTEEWSQYRITRTAGGYSVTASADWENGQIPDEIPMAGASPRKWVRAVVERNGDKIPVWRLISPGQGVRDYFRMNDDYGPDGSESGTDFVEVVSIGDADANTEYPEGMLYRTVDDYGNVHRYEYGTFELFQDVDDYEEYAFRPTAIYINEDSQGIPELRVDYRWNDQVPGSPRYGRLRGIDAYRESSTEDETLVAQVTYTYMHEAISSFFSPDLGRDGDLVQVVTSMRVDAGPGESTSGSEIEDAPEQWREQITQYRYHRGDAATNGDVSSGVGTDYTWSGGDRQIKAIIQTEQIEFAHSARLSETPPTPADSMLGDSLLMLGMSDGEVIYGTGADEVRLIDLASKVVEEYYDSGPNVGRVETQYLKAGCGCSGAGSHGRKLEYAYFEHSSESATTVITELVDDQVHLITYHDLEIENDFPFLVTKVVEDGQDSSARWGTHYIYNDDRQVEFEITPSAMQSYVAHHETDGPEFTAHTDEGLVYAYIYGGAFFRAETRVGEGLHSESPFAYMLFNVVEYDGTRPHLPTKVTRFTNDDLLGPDCQSDPCQEVTEYDYGFHTEDGHDVAWVRTRVETETTGENGAVDPDPYYSSYELFDERGRNFWSRAADDALTYREFDQSGRVVLIERNADNSSLPSTHGHANENPLDTGSWPDRHSDGGSLVTTIVRDALGRVREQISPAGVSSYTVREMRPFSEAESALRYVEITLPFALGSSPETYNGPARMTWFNAAGRVIGTESYLIGAGGYTPAGVGEDPNYVRTFEDYDLGDLVARSLREYDLIGQLKSETVWHDVDDDDKSFTTLYDYDSHGRVSKVTQPNETVTATEYDVLGRVIERQTGTSVMNLKTVAEYIYDSPDASSTAGVGNGNLTRVIQYVDDSAERITDYHYDFRDRRVWTINELPPHQYVEYDHLGRVTGQAMYTAVPADLENPGYTDRGSYSWMEYNRRGLVYRQLTAVEPGVDPGAGSPEFLESNTWYDPAGRVIAQLGPGAPMSLTQFDGLGRTVASYTGASDYQALDELYDESSFAIKLNDVAVVEQTEYRYIDNTGQMDLVTTRQRLHDVEDATMGALDGTIAIAVYRGVDYDAAGRAFRQINFGTRHGDGFARESYGSGIDSITTSLTNGLQVFDLEPEDLVTETTFDEQGRVLETIDPKAIATRYVYDDLGRRIAVIENAVGTVDVGWHAEDRWEVTSGLDPNHPDRNRVTSYVYDEIGNVTKQVAHLPDGAGESVQVTEYVYGVSTTHAVASEIDSEDLLYQTIYPEGEGSTTEAERTVTYAYNRLGEMIKMVDQNGTVHVYERDALGRVTADIADSIATHIDDAVTAIGMTYDDLGRRSKVRSYSSYDAQNPGSNVVNAVEFTYTPLSQIESVIQNPFGEIGTITGTSTTRAVTLSYDTVTGGGGGGNHSRMDELTYPGGLEIGSAYGNAGSINDQISRLDTIGFQSGVHYKYIGMHMTAVVDYATPDVQLDRTTDFDGSRNYGGGGSGGGQSGNAGKYPGYDRFGRVVQHRWVDGGFRPHHGGSLHNQTDKPHVPPIYELVHTYDEASNRLARDNTTATLAWSFHDERFEYDDLHRLTQSERGTDAGSGYTQSTDQPGRQWDLDMLGNWNEQRTWDGSAYGDVETRDHSDANELTGLTPDGASTALAMTYDAAGNLLSREIEAPAGGSGTVTMHFTWDAWNRLVAVNYGSSERLKQSYNGLNWRVLKWSDAT